MSGERMPGGDAQPPYLTGEGSVPAALPPALDSPTAATPVVVPTGLVARLTVSAGLRHGVIMAMATLTAGALDYLFNVVSGRMLAPAEYGVLISVTAILQVMVHLTNVIRNVTARYTASLTARPEAIAHIGLFVRRIWRWSWRWGLVAMFLLALLSPLLARLLQLPTAWPLWVASLALLLLFLRPVTDGTLQGLQDFAGLGAVAILQAGLRLGLAVLLISWSRQAAGALLALPLASAGALLFALYRLRPQFGADGAAAVKQPISWQYSLQTLAGLLAFALLVNMDALVVKLAFSPEAAGHYGPVVTLGKMNLFIPLAMGMVLFPKTTQRQASGRDPRPVLVLALLATLIPGFLLTALYFALPGPLVHAVFTDAYQNPGLVLGLVGLATTLFAGLNIWLNYALSLDRPLFVYALVGTAVLQATAMALFHHSLVAIALSMVAAGLLGNLAGFLTTWQRVVKPPPVGYT
jgi:O-antigen/teichoic acid export membrane protein